MRQNATRCLGNAFLGLSNQSSQAQPLLRMAGSLALQPAAITTAPTTAKPNLLTVSNQNRQMQKWLTTLQQKTTTASQATGVRTMSSNHPKIWAAEKLVSLIMVPGVIVPFLWTTPLTDAIFCTLW